MACNCGGRKPPRPAPKPRPKGAAAGSNSTQSFTLVDRAGGELTFGSRLEAEAANARSGFRGIVRPS